MSENRKKNRKLAQTPGLAERNTAVEALLVDGEELLVQGQVHPAIYWKSAAVLAVALLVTLKAPPLGVVFGVFGMLMLVFAVLTRHFLLIALTNRRILARYGILQTDVVTVKFDKIESVEMERMLLGHILGYATVVAMGTGQRVIRIPFIANAAEFRRKYDEVTLEKD